MAVYLLHYHEKIAHAQHYMGYARNAKKRIEAHRNGSSGARLPRVFFERGIGFDVGLILPDGTRQTERQLKKIGRHNSRLCEICKAQKNNDQISNNEVREPADDLQSGDRAGGT